MVLSTYRLMNSDGSLAAGRHAPVAAAVRTGTWKTAEQGTWEAVCGTPEPRPCCGTRRGFPRRKSASSSLNTISGKSPAGGTAARCPSREIQSFAVGYQPEVEIESPLIDLGTSKNLTTIHWEADEPPGTRVEISTRTGNETETLHRFFRKDGSELAESDYNALPKSFRGEIKERLVPGADWSEWSRPVNNRGDRVVSPSPRRLMKIRARLMSDDPDLSATLRRLSIRFTSPWVERALGEVYPTQLDHLGKASPLTLYLRPRPRPFRRRHRRDPGGERQRRAAEPGSAAPRAGCRHRRRGRRGSGGARSDSHRARFPLGAPSPGRAAQQRGSPRHEHGRLRPRNRPVRQRRKLQFAGQLAARRPPPGGVGGHPQRGDAGADPSRRPDGRRAADEAPPW